jgi:hypothetical protein
VRGEERRDREREEMEGDGTRWRWRWDQTLHVIWHEKARISSVAHPNRGRKGDGRATAVIIITLSMLLLLLLLLYGVCIELMVHM